MTRKLMHVGTSLGALAAGMFLALGCGSGAASAAAVPPAVADVTAAPGGGLQTVVLSGGCFWGMQLVFEHLKGVDTVTAGYAGGDASTATYEQVETGDTGHAESVRIVFDPSQITYGQILQVFFGIAHDPTQRNRQGPDVGPQYRSVIWFANDEQKRVAQSYIAQLEKAKTFPRPIVTEVAAFHGFYPAESYHQNYGDVHPDDPYIVYNDKPKLEHFRRDLPSLYREARAASGAGSAIAGR